jgi:hypothetical protein
MLKDPRQIFDIGRGFFFRVKTRETMIMMTIQKLTYTILTGGVMLMLFSPMPTEAQQATTQQSITLRVEEINKVSINLPTIQLIISQAQGNSGSQAQGNSGDTVSVVNTDGLLSWATNGDNKKITVTSDRPSSRFILKLAAQNTSTNAGTAMPEVFLNDNQPHDLVVGVSKTSGRCYLRVTGSTTLNAGVGTESYILTYTITNS